MLHGAGSWAVPRAPHGTLGGGWRQEDLRCTHASSCLSQGVCVPSHLPTWHTRVPSHLPEPHIRVPSHLAKWHIRVPSHVSAWHILVPSCVPMCHIHIPLRVPVWHIHVPSRAPTSLCASPMACLCPITSS